MAMVTGSTTDATDDAVQANIVAVGYKNIPEPDVLAGYVGFNGDCAGNNIAKTQQKQQITVRCNVKRCVAALVFSFHSGREVCITKSAACANPTEGNDFKFYRRKAG